jgi:hypothetical protein
MNPICQAACAALLGWCGANAVAAEPAHDGAARGGADARPAPEQRMRRDLDAVVSQMAVSGALGQHPEHASLTLSEPAHRVNDVGALVDSTSARSAQDGLRVLGATPGSTADRLGLQAGDVIVAVNGTSLRNLGADENGRALAASTMRSVVDTLPDDARLSVDVVRGGSRLTLSAPVQHVYVPAMHVQIGDGALAAGGGGDAAASAGCGRISAFDVAPRGQHLYAARILLIDGVTPGPGTPSYRVEAGEHRLLVAENIPTQALGVGEIATFRRQTSKPLTVVVEPGKTALVAAQLHLDRSTDLRGGYWDPVVWKQIDEACR